MAELQILE